MLVVPDGMLDVGDTNTSDIDVPPVDVVALGQGVHYPGLDGIAVDDFNLLEPDALLEAG